MARAVLPLVAALRVTSVGADGADALLPLPVPLPLPLPLPLPIQESATIDDCRTLCDETEGCKGFVYIGQTCHLKDALWLARVRHTQPTVEQPTVEQPTCPDFEAELTDTDLTGDLLNSVGMEESATIDDCCALCDETEGCKGFVLFEQTCYLKGGSVGTVANEGRISRLRQQPVCADFEAELSDTDLTGDLLNSFLMEEGATIDDCCTLCDDAEGCKGFTYFEQTCYLKGGSVGTFANEGRISRLRQRPPVCGDFEAELNDTDLGGELLSSIWMEGNATADDCCFLCDETEGCKGFVHFLQTCYLKGGPSSNMGTFTNAGRITRRRNRCSGFQPAESGKDLGGDMLFDFSAPASEVCCEVCGSNQDCQGFAFAGERCYLKTNVTGTFPNSNCVASIKDGFPTRRLGGSMVFV